MTADHRPPDPLRTALEASGWRHTRQRAAVYRQLAACATSHEHPTAEDLYQAVRVDIPSISLATVYKALEALVASGLVSKLPTGDGSSRYDARVDDHYHLRCVKTGSVEDLPTDFDRNLVRKLDPDLEQRLKERGFHVTGYRLELLGFYDVVDPA